MRLTFSQSWISYTQVFNELICETVLSRYSQRYLDEELSSDARFRDESAPGLTDSVLAYAARAKSLRLLSAVIFAQVSWFTRSSRLPRPASPASTTKVETVHPQVNLGNYVEKRNSHYLVLLTFLDNSPNEKLKWICFLEGMERHSCLPTRSI